MKFKRVIALLFASAATTICFGQSAKDFFMPAKTKNFSAFERTSDHTATKRIYYKDNGDSAVVTTLYKMGKKWQGIEQRVMITSSEIYSGRGKGNTDYGVESFDEGGKLIFKMPDPDGKASWTNPGQKGTLIQTYESEFVTINVNGKPTRAVKITVILQKRRTGEKEGFYADYYVEGMGLYRRTSPTGDVVVESLRKQKYERHPIAINEKQNLKIGRLPE